MAKSFRVFWLSFLLIGSVLAEQRPTSEPKKTVLVLSSKGGGGHIAAANALQSLLGHEYHFKVVTPIDQLRIWGIPSGEQFYNFMLKKGWIRAMNFIVRHLAPPIFKARLSKLEKIVASYIQTYQPDLVISLIPFVNYSATEAARKAKVPYLLITTDNDLRNWVFGMDRIKHPQFKVTIGADLPTTRDILKKKKIKDEAIETVGLPLRPQFLLENKTSTLLEELQIPENKPVILIMMGGAGGVAAYEYAKKIGKMGLGAHLIVVAGRNESLKEELNRLKLHALNSLTAIGYTERVAELMSLSTVIITKPGPGTINEAMAMRLPILIDNTGTSLFWERANVDMVLSYKIGERIRYPKEIKKVLLSYLYDPQQQQAIANSFVEIPKNQFHLRIQGLIEELIAEKEKVNQVVEKDSIIEMSAGTNI